MDQQPRIGREAIMTDAEILANARVVSPEAVALDNQELAAMKFWMQITKLVGKQPCFITWPNGITISVDEAPGDRAAWEALIVKSYRAAVAGWVGPISAQEAI
jgi:hypothetical protein